MRIGTRIQYVPDAVVETALKPFTSITLDTPKYGEISTGFNERYTWAKNHYDTIRGNCLLYFPTSSPILCREVTEDSLQQYVISTVKQYSAITHWDVVNEIMSDNGVIRLKTKPYCVEKTVVHPILSISNWLSKLFTWASSANPDAEFFLNDYRPMNTVKWKAILSLVASLKDAGTRIDGIGIQIHHHLPRACMEGFFTWKTLKDTIRAAKHLGLKVHLTEVSIWSPIEAGTALAYYQITQLAKDEGVDNVTFISLSDHPQDHWTYTPEAKGAGVYTEKYQLKIGMDKVFNLSH